jgi:DNA repair protein RadA
MTTEIKDAREYFRSKYKQIEDLPGIGEATATTLKKAGFSSVEMIASATAKELVTGGLGEETANKVIELARKGFAHAFITGSQLMELRRNQKFLTTGCDSLDELMTRQDQVGQPKGLPTESITELTGENGSGKSQLCHQLCVTVQLPLEAGGLDGNALYIDTEQVFTPSRVIQISNRFSNLLGDKKGAKILDGITYAEAYTSDHQAALLAGAEDVIKENNVKLIIIDSLTGNFRAEFLGRETLSARQQSISEHMHKLMRMAVVFKCVAVVTNQVQADPTPYSGFDPKPIGGHIVGHISHDRIFIRKLKDGKRIAKILKSPFLPEGEAVMHLTGDGMVGERSDAPKGDEI